MTYIMLEKNPTPYYVRERISNSRGLGKTFSPKLNHPYLSLLYKSRMVSHIGGEEEADLCHPSTKWLARVHHVVVFKTNVLHFKIENTPIKDTNRKRTFKRMLRFLFVDKLELFPMKLSFEELNLDQPGFPYGGSERLACFEPTEAARFLKKLEVDSALYSVKEVGYVHLKLIFFAMSSADKTCVNGSRIQLVLYANCLLGLN